MVWNTFVSTLIDLAGAVLGVPKPSKVEYYDKLNSPWLQNLRACSLILRTFGTILGGRNSKVAH